jgi:hypothetical protein
MLLASKRRWRGSKRTSFRDETNAFSFKDPLEGVETGTKPMLLASKSFASQTSAGQRADLRRGAARGLQEHAQAGRKWLKASQ